MFTNSNGSSAFSGCVCLVPVLGDLSGHHQEWLGSAATIRHRVAALDFATVSGCGQPVIGAIPARGGTLDLLMTDVPDSTGGCCSTTR